MSEEGEGNTGSTEADFLGNTMVAHFVCLLFTGFIIYVARPGSSLFSWHPTLMSIAFLLLMAQAVLAFSPQSSLIHNAKRSTKVTVHWILMLLSLCSALGGGFAIWYNKELNNKSHLTSLHGKLGFITTSYAAVQCCAGANLLYPKMATKFVKLVSLKRLHAVSGTFLFILVCASLFTGMKSSWFQSLVTGTSHVACLACPFVMLAIIANQVRLAHFSHKTSQS